MQCVESHGLDSGGDVAFGHFLVILQLPIYFLFFSSVFGGVSNLIVGREVDTVRCVCWLEKGRYFD